MTHIKNKIYNSYCMKKDLFQMVKDIWLKGDRFLISCIAVSFLVALLMPVFEHIQKPIESEATPIQTAVPVPFPSSSPVSDPEPIPIPEPAPASDPSPVIEVLEPVDGLPHPIHFISGWDKCLDVLHVDCNIAFLGDSITYMSFFDVYFPDYTICNLGVVGDTIEGLNRRIGTLQTVKPEKVFVLIGANSLRNDTIDKCIEDYRTLVSNIQSLGDYDLYLISVTPRSENEEGNDDPSPETIMSFNQIINDIAAENDAGYLDLFAQLQDSGYIRPEYTIDGLHLSEDGYGVWADFIRPYIEG